MPSLQTLETGFQFKDNPIPLRPTLFIGLGGSGMRTLRALRRQFIMRFGTPHLPCVRYLYLDTDLQGFKDGSADSDVPGVPFDEASETIDLTLPPAQFKQWVENPVANRHIHEWLDPKVVAMGGMEHGASQSRQAGRLAFFAKFAAIRMKLGALQAELVSADTAQRMLEMGFADYHGGALDVVFLFSLAGGTGAGCFLDMAFLLRHLGMEQWNVPVNIHGYAYLPPLFFPDTSTDQGQKTHANAMAALRELEYYGSRKDILERVDGSPFALQSKHDFRVQWSAHEPERTIMGPPFQLLYLVDCRTDASLPLRGPDTQEAFEVVANWHFLKFTGNGFAARLRSDGNNMLPYLAQDVVYMHADPDNPKGQPVHMEQLGQRLCGMGLSRIHVPADEIRRACTMRMGVDLLDLWLRPGEVQGDVQGHTTAMLAELEADRPRMMERILRPDPQTDFRNLVRSQVETGMSALRERLRGAARRQLATAVSEHFVRLRNPVDMPPNSEPVQWGSMARSIVHDQKNPLRAVSAQRMSERLRIWLDQSSKGLNWTRRLLEELDKLLGLELDEWDRQAEREGKLAGRELERLKRLNLYIKDEQATWFTQRASLTALLDSLRASETEYLLARLREMACRTAKEHHLWLKDQVRAENSRLGRLVEDLREGRAALQMDLEAADRGKPSVTEVKLHGDGAYLQFYRIQAPGDPEANPIGRNHLEELQRQVFSDLEWVDNQPRRVTGLVDLPAYLKLCGWETLKIQVVKRARDWFSPTANRMDLNLADHLARMEEKTRKDYLDKLTQWSQPWTHVPADSGLHTQKIVRIGRHPDHDLHPHVQTMIRHVTATAGGTISAPTLLDGERDAFWVASEVYGLPAFSVFNVGSYREAYHASLSGGDTQRHITRHIHRFPAVQHLSDQEVKHHLSAVRVLLGCVLTGVVSVQVLQDEAGLRHCEFGFQDKQEAPAVPVNLMHWDQALKLLKSNPRHLEYLEQLWIRRLATLSQREREQLVLALYRMKQARGLFSRRSVNDVNNPQLHVVCAEHTQCDRLMKEWAAHLGWSTEDIDARFSPIGEAEVAARLTKVEDDQLVLFIPREEELD